MLTLISFLNNTPFWMVWLLQLVICYSMVLVMMRFFGKAGIFVFMGIMIIAGNIQVMKLAYFPFYTQPIPLGTTLFAATYLASDVLAEYYGREAAKQGIFLAFSAMVIFTLTMILTLGFKPLTYMEALNINMPEATHTQAALLTLFTPTLALLCASLISFLIAQFTDIWIFLAIKKVSHQKWLWLRNNVACWISALLDNTVFSLLAWRLVSSNPVPWHTLIFGYIFGTYLLRVLVSALNTPFIYMAKQAHPKKR